MEFVCQVRSGENSQKTRNIKIIDYSLKKDVFAIRDFYGPGTLSTSSPLPGMYVISRAMPKEFSKKNTTINLNQKF